MRIVLEGLPGAGKTTHATRLAHALQCPLVPEWATLTEAEWQSHPLRAPYYLANDEAKEFMGQLFTGPLVIFDRHYTGALAYGYALTTVRGATRTQGECYEVNFEWYQRCRQTNALTQPTAVLVIDIPPTTSIQRQPRASAGDPVWGDVACLEAMRVYYRHFYSHIEPQVHAVWLDGEQPTEIIYQTLHAEITRLSK